MELIHVQLINGAKSTTVKPVGDEQQYQPGVEMPAEVEMPDTECGDSSKGLIHSNSHYRRKVYNLYERKVEGIWIRP